jgi:hypothetical protein
MLGGAHHEGKRWHAHAQYQPSVGVVPPISQS